MQEGRKRPPLGERLLAAAREALAHARGEPGEVLVFVPPKGAKGQSDEGGKLMREVRYLAALTPEVEGGYSVTFPDVRGAITQGDDLDEAVANAREALELIVEADAEAGEDLPARRPFEQACREIAERGALPAVITVAAPI